MAASCSTLHNHLDPISLKFKSQCSDTTFCSAAENGTCIPRKCRRDEFPFGYSYQDVLPPLCLPGTFCPDEGSGCLPLVFIGGACQLNRDEQCALPPDMTDPDQVLCLGSVCTYALALPLRLLLCFVIADIPTSIPAGLALPTLQPTRTSLMINISPLLSSEITVRNHSTIVSRLA